jgi:hypothetical protein
MGAEIANAGHEDEDKANDSIDDFFARDRVGIS